MFLRELTGPVSGIRGAGPAAVRALAEAGIHTTAALLCHYPRDWEDHSRAVPIRDFNRAPVNTLIRVIAHDWIGSGRMKTLKVYVEDDTGRAALVCFNRPFLGKQLITGSQYRVWGRFFYKYGEIQSTNFDIEPPDTGYGEPGKGGAKKRFGRILPVYPLSGRLKQALLRQLTGTALDQYAKDLDDELPPEITGREGLIPKSRAIRAIHFPQSMEELEKARKTLIWEELFYLEVMVGKRSLERKKSAAPAASVSPPARFSLSPLQTRLLERLPFDLTPGQTEAASEIGRDMDGPYPMARLLQGDVGSGKTLVAFLAALRAVEESPRGQAAIMAPTELLARQHAENAARLLEPLGIRISFLTGNIRAAGRKELLKSLASGETDMVVGTHALFSRDTVYKNLRLVVVDEQHRFGVTQRSLIMAKGGRPDLLMMSATPIPRTLALTVFGDLDVSVIRDMPPDRKPVKTHLARESNEGKVYDFVRKELAAGHQAYFVYPLIGDADPGGSASGRLEPADSASGGDEEDASGAGGLKDAVSMAERLSRRIFPQYPGALIHSKVEEEEKQRIMEGFRRGQIRILAATSVVEVGVDVPNASCMVVEHAERFGLSALHQLRGRVGRGSDQAYCFLVYSDTPPAEPREDGPDEIRRRGDLTEDGKARLRVMLENTDGFVIAEEDLKLRGPGQIAGIEQSGYLTLGLADPVRDAAELARARTDAFAMLETDPALLQPEHRCVAEVLTRAPPFSTVTL
jgi:ATP-dependent DNA helicase RecG